MTEAVEELMPQNLNIDDQVHYVKDSYAAGVEEAERGLSFLDAGRVSLEEQEEESRNEEGLRKGQNATYPVVCKFPAGYFVFDHYFPSNEIVQYPVLKGLDLETGWER